MDENQQPLVSIIVLNYNAKDILIDCIDSVFQSNYQNFEVILVDNDSDDNSFEICKKNYPEIKLIVNKSNLGYCGGNNIGIKEARGEFIIILNPDTLVEPNWINEFLKSYKKFGDAIYQPKFISTDDHEMLLSTGQMINLFGFGFSRDKGSYSKNKKYESEKIAYASGTCMFLPLTIMKNLNYFDNFLFAYHDDLDLCWRASMMNIDSYFVPNSIVFHPREGYVFKWSKYKFYLMERNRMYCILTHYSRKTITKLFPALLIIDIGVLLFYMKKGMAKEKIKASFNILKNLKTIHNRNNQLQKFRTVPDKEIIKKFEDEIQVPEWILSNDSNNLFSQYLKKLSIFSRKFI